jgi:hypothetical protein
MYYIYHIKGVKIGCTKHLTRRMREQGFVDYEILETHEDINIASEREIELQNKFGYKDKFCKTIYKVSVDNAHKSTGGFKEGNEPWNIGKKHTKETIEKMKKAKLGRKHTEETKQKQREAALKNRLWA